MKNIKDLANKWKDILCLFIERKTQNYIKMSVFPKLIYKFNIIPITLYPGGFRIRIWESFSGNFTKWF